MNTQIAEHQAVIAAALQVERAMPANVADEDEFVLTHRAVEGAGIGAGVGAFIGAVAAAIAAAITSVALPGFGVLMAGPIAAALIGAGAGVANGTLVGALIGWSIPQERRATTRVA